MVQLQPVGDGTSRVVEVAPARCPNGHRLGPLEVLVGFDKHPSGEGRARVWTCRTCGAETWAEPSR